MKQQGNLFRPVLGILIVTVFLLLVPFIAMQYTSEVNWSAGDFLIMGALISGTGLVYVALTRTTPNWLYRIAAALALGTTFLMIWANLAVGLIGSGPHAGNFMYMAVVAVVITGILLSRFRSAGMERTMYAAALSLVLLTVIAFLAGMQHYPGSSAKEILGVACFFGVLYLVAGILFRYVSGSASRKQAHA